MHDLKQLENVALGTFDALARTYLSSGGSKPLLDGSNSARRHTLRCMPPSQLARDQK